MKNLQVALLIALTLLFTENTIAQTMGANTKKSQGIKSIANAASPSHPVQVSQLMMHKDQLLFKENKGQLKEENGILLPEVNYYGQQAGVYVYCKPGMISFVFTKVEKDELKSAGSDKQNAALFNKHRRVPDPALHKPSKIAISPMDLVFLNSNISASIIPSDRQEFYENFYTTDDINNGITYVHSFKTLTYKEIYPHIDMVLKTETNGMEYSFIVHPGGKVEDIQLQWDGIAERESLVSGGFRYTNSSGTLDESAPESFCAGKFVKSSFKQEGDICGFEVEGYDKTKDLLIDPSLSWATYYAGYETWVSSMCTDIAGNVYITGTIDGSNGFVAKFSGDDSLLWSTLYNSPYGTTFGSGVCTDAAGNVLVSGTTEDFGFSWNLYFVAFVAKLSSSGISQWGFIIGYDATYGGEITTDASNNVLVTGYSSTGGIATSGAHQTSYSGGGDAFLMKINSSGGISWATMYGGNNYDAIRGVIADASGNIYITGITNSGSLSSSGSYQASNAGNGDAFLAKFSSSGSLSWATYFGGGDFDAAEGISKDLSGNVFITGETYSDSGIATIGAFQDSLAGDEDAFLAKFSNSGGMIWATYYGGDQDEGARDITADKFGNQYITGTTNSSCCIATTGAHQSSPGGTGADAFLAKFNSSGILTYGTYFGGSEDDYGLAVCRDGVENVYVAGGTYSSGLATSGAYQTSFPVNSPNAAFLAKFRFAILNDAGIESIVAPSGILCSADSQALIVNLQNHGITTLTSATLGWSVNGTPQTSYNWTGSLPPGNYVNVIVSSGYLFSSGVNKIAAYTSQPNGVSDSLRENDTARMNFIFYVRPSANAGSNKNICIGDSISIGTAVMFTGNTYAWTSSPAGFTSKSSNPTVYPTITTTYYLTETDTATYINASDTATGCSRSDSVKITVNPLPSATTAAAQIICYAKSISIGATAVSGNTYSWTSTPGGFTSVSANPIVNPTITTRYYLTETITATSCFNSDSVMITVNPLPVANAGSNKTICEGDSISIGGPAVNGNTYLWISVPAGFISSTANPSVSPISTTVFSLTETIVATGCSEANAVTVTVNPMPPANAGSDKTICNGESTFIGASASSGNAYFWTSDPAGFISVAADPTVNPTITTDYYLIETILATGCAKSDSVKVTVNTLPIVTANADATTVCEGTMVTLKGSGALSYSWSDGIVNEVGFVPTFTNTYMVTGTDSNNCSNSASITVNVNPLPIATTFLIGTTIISNQNGATWQWLDCNSGYFPIAGATNQSFTAAVNGDYAVMVTLNACSDTSDCKSVTNVGIEQAVKNNDGLTVYPNPSSNAFTVQATKEGSYSIINTLGQVIHEFELNEFNNYKLQIENLGGGVYFIVGFNDNQYCRQKVVVAR